MTDKERLYVSTIAQCSSITKAADRLFIAQPSLTQALHRIEAEYGVAFFRRERGGLRLTEAGQSYLDATEKMERIYQRMKEDIGTEGSGHQGRINLGITAFQGGVLLPEFLSLYQQRYPRIELKLLESSSAQLEQLAFEGRLDMIVLHRPFWDYDLNYIALHQEDIFLAVSPDNADYRAAAEREGPVPCITSEMMARQWFNMLTANQRSRQVADMICAAAGVVPKINFTTSSFITALALTAKGMGATFVPVSFARYYAKRFKVSYFRFPAGWNANWELVAAYAKNLPLSQHCLEMVRVLQECIASMPEVFS